MVSAQTASESIISRIALMTFAGKGVTVDLDGTWNEETLNHRYHVSFRVWDLATGERERDRETVREQKAD